MDEEKIITQLEKELNNITLIEFYTQRQELKKYYKKVYKREIRKRWQKLIGSFKMADYKKEKIWEYLNNDISEEDFYKFVSSTFESVYKRTK